MTKRFISALLVVVLVVGAVCGCSAKDVPFRHNQVDENRTYINEYLNIGIQFDSDWEITSDDELCNINNLEDMNDDKFEEAIQEFGFINELQAKNKSALLNIGYVYPKVLYDTEMDENDYIDNRIIELNNTYEDMQPTIDYRVEKSKIWVCETEYSCINIKALGGKRVIIPIKGEKYMGIISLGALYEDEAETVFDYILNLFYML